MTVFLGEWEVDNTANLPFRQSRSLLSARPQPHDPLERAHGDIRVAACTRQSAPRAEASNGFTGVSIESQGGHLACAGLAAAVAARSETTSVVKRTVRSM
jgi:hypothetical protein